MYIFYDIYLKVLDLSLEVMVEVVRADVLKVQDQVSVAEEADSMADLSAIRQSCDARCLRNYRRYCYCYRCKQNINTISLRATLQFFCTL